MTQKPCCNQYVHETKFNSSTAYQHNHTDVFVNCYLNGELKWQTVSLLQYRSLVNKFVLGPDRFIARVMFLNV